MTIDDPDLIPCSLPPTMIADTIPSGDSRAAEESAEAAGAARAFAEPTRSDGKFRESDPLRSTVVPAPASSDLVRSCAFTHPMGGGTFGSLLVPARMCGDDPNTLTYILTLPGVRPQCPGCSRATVSVASWSAKPSLKDCRR